MIAETKLRILTQLFLISKQFFTFTLFLQFTDLSIGVTTIGTNHLMFSSLQSD